jgi:hypothetical protein
MVLARSVQRWRIEPVSIGTGRPRCSFAAAGNAGRADVAHVVLDDAGRRAVRGDLLRALDRGTAAARSASCHRL